jgi:hypothetical protein
MTMKKDHFWTVFWSAAGVFILFLGSLVIWLKFLYLNLPDDPQLALAVGVTFDPSKDPFEASSTNRTPSSLFSGYLYEDSIPYGFSDWSWDTAINWRNNTDPTEGSYAAYVQFLKPWAGARLATRPLNLSSYNSLKVAVKPDANVQDLYIQLYDKYGNASPRQSLGWYAASGSLTQGQWNTVLIPLDNLLSSADEKKSVTGFSISSETPGGTYMDDVELKADLVVRDKWKEPENSTYAWIGSDPFSGTVQVPLPYTMSFDDESLKSWKQLFGQFTKMNDAILVGPVPKKTTGSMAVFGGGKDWTDYRVDATAYWGVASSLSLIARFQNDKNFVSCAYSNYGQIVQIYSVKDGDSELLGQTPALAISGYEPWKNVKQGMEVRGDRVSCYLNGDKVLSADISDMPPSGTVGIETWTQNSEDYGHKILDLSVNPLSD